MKPGRELDALIAEKIFGCVVSKNRDSYYVEAPEDENGIEYGCVSGFLQNYSTDIKAAWEVVERMKYHMPEVKMSESCGEFFFIAHFYNFEAVGETAPHAISLAALKAKGIEI